MSKNEIITYNESAAETQERGRKNITDSSGS
jgi:hypothetical protein